jgi:transposase
LVGRVEVDESYFGGKRQRGRQGKLKRGRGILKQPVFGEFEREGRVYTEIVPDCKRHLQRWFAGLQRLGGCRLFAAF